MDTMSAFAMGEVSRHKEPKVFDWKKAANLIKELNGQDASAGLIEDWEWTGGEIFRDGKIVPEEDTYVYLLSTWATPVVIIDDVEYDCYVMKSKTKYDAETYWPEDAVKILNNK